MIVAFVHLKILSLHIQLNMVQSKKGNCVQIPFPTINSSRRTSQHCDMDFK